MSNRDHKLKIIPSKNKKEKRAEIILENELTSSVLDNLQLELTDLLKEFETIDIKLRNIDSIDLSFIQYLFSLQSTAEARAKKVNLNAECNDDIKNLLINTGLYRLFN